MSRVTVCGFCGVAGELTSALRRVSVGSLGCGRGLMDLLFAMIFQVVV